MAKGISFKDAQTLLDNFIFDTNSADFDRLVAYDIYTEKGSNSFDRDYIRFLKAFSAYVVKALVEEGTADSRSDAEKIVADSQSELDNAVVSAIIDEQQRKAKKGSLKKTASYDVRDLLMDLNGHEDSTVYVVMQPNYPLVCEIDHVETDRGSDDEPVIYIHLTDSFDYYSSEDEAEDEDEEY